MATSKKERPLISHRTGTVGLLANGSSGQWDVAIDETTTGTDRWFVQLVGPSVSFYYEIPSVSIVGKMVRFLETTTATDFRDANASLVIGKVEGLPVTFVKDDEFLDRFFLVVGPLSSPAVRFVVTGTDVAMIVEGLRQVEDDLDEGD